MSLADEIRDDRPGMTAADRLERIHADARAIAGEVPELVVTIEPATVVAQRAEWIAAARERMAEIEEALEREQSIAANAARLTSSLERQRDDLTSARDDALERARAAEEALARYRLADRLESDDPPAADDGAASADPPEAPAAPEARVHCTRARTDMTPCVVADGDVARDDDGDCVGCGLSQIPELRGTARAAAPAPEPPDRPRLDADMVREAMRAINGEGGKASMGTIARRLVPGHKRSVGRHEWPGTEVDRLLGVLTDQGRARAAGTYRGGTIYEELEQEAERAGLRDYPEPEPAIPGGTRMPSGTRAGGLSPRTAKSVAKAAEEAGALEGTRPPIRSLALQALAEGKLTMPEIAKALDLPPALAAQEISLLQRAEPEPLVEKQFDKYAITDAGRRELQR